MNINGCGIVHPCGVESSGTAHGVNRYSLRVNAATRRLWISKLPVVEICQMTEKHFTELDGLIKS